MKTEAEDRGAGAAGIGPSIDALRKRRARIAAGRDSEAKARAWSRGLSLQGMMETPLLEALDDLGGAARPRDVYERVATRIGLDDEALEEARTTADGQTYVVYQQQVRWARQTAVGRGLIGRDVRGTWTLTDKGRERLAKASDGQVVLVYRLDDGFAFWARAEDAAGLVEPGGVKLLLTSPPYPQIDREYGRQGVAEWLAWMTSLMAAWRDVIDERGTITLNLGDVHVPGSPCISPYVERLVLAATDRIGLHFAGRTMWHSNSKLGHIEWAAKRRVTPANRLEHVLSFSRGPFPDWDTRRLPVPARPDRDGRRSRADAARATERRPTGKLINPGAFGAGDPVPGNLIVSGGASGGDAYSRACRAAGIATHPARFPEALPRYVIALATRPGDVVMDPMAGSNTTGMIASRMGRRFVSCDATRGYVEGSALRFADRADLIACGR